MVTTTTLFSLPHVEHELYRVLLGFANDLQVSVVCVLATDGRFVEHQMHPFRSFLLLQHARPLYSGITEQSVNSNNLVPKKYPENWLFNFIVYCQLPLNKQMSDPRKPIASIFYKLKRCNLNNQTIKIILEYIVEKKIQCLYYTNIWYYICATCGYTNLEVYMDRLKCPI